MKAALNLLLAVLFIFGIPSAPVNCQTQGGFDIGNEPVDPFKIAGNIYYVGASDVTSFLITTPKGHILIDSGLPETVPQIVKNIATLGFKLSDVKIILNSHAHFDHAGGIGELRRLTHAKFYASRRDVPLLKRGGLADPNFGDRFPFESTPPDIAFQNGRQVSIGGVTLTANITAGHTPGCTTWTTTAVEGKSTLDVAFICSVSSPTYKLVENKKYPDIEKDYLKSFALLEKMHVDVFLASHAGFFRLAEKIAEMKRSPGKNPFIDPDGYRNFLKDSKSAFLEKLKTQKAAAGQSK